MIIVFRADASHKMGIGHVMRCLALANHFQSENDEIHFITRDADHLPDSLFLNKQYIVHLLPRNKATNSQEQDHLRNEECIDAKETLDYLISLESPPDWLIVDHYKLGAFWEHQMSPAVKKIMVIDDLASRKHICQVLLDQTYQRQKTAYEGLTPKESLLLLGSQYALLRKEFALYRQKALAKKNHPYKIKTILISLGGTDPKNITLLVLQALEEARLSNVSQINVLLSSHNPHLEEIRAYIAASSMYKISLISNAQNIAKLMSEADLAIGAAGSTSWERCCLGLPSIMLITAKNQKDVAFALEKAGAAVSLDFSDNTNLHQLAKTIRELNSDPVFLWQMSKKARLICDGLGASRSVAFLTSKSKE